MKQVIAVTVPWSHRSSREEVFQGMPLRVVTIEIRPSAPSFDMIFSYGSTNKVSDVK